MIKITLIKNDSKEVKLVDTLDEALNEVTEWKLDKPFYRCDCDGSAIVISTTNKREAIRYERATAADVFAENIAKSGYANRDEISSILNKLNDKEIDTLAYACYRAAEKIGDEIFESNELVDIHL